MIPRLLVSTLVLGLAAVPAHATSVSPYATEVVSYTPGANVMAGFDQPQSALGEPARANVGQFPGDAGVFNSIFEAESLVSIGVGGELTVRFDHHVMDDPLNPFGIDLIVFGNSFLTAVFGQGDPFAAGVLEGEPGIISVSQNGVDFFDASAATGIFADELFPTLGYTDTQGPFGGGGTQPTDFTLPVDPALTATSFTGLFYDEAAALYLGSGGGGGIDLAALGLPWIEYVRITHLLADEKTTEIAGFADVAIVPEPTPLLLLAAGLLALLRARQRGARAGARQRG